MNLPPLLDPSRHALFTDFDGTLVELVNRPEEVWISPRFVAFLAHLQKACGGAFAVISGRRIHDLDRFLQPLAFASAGIHGLERREEPHGFIASLASPEALDTIRFALSAGVVAEPRLHLEDKKMALVVHYRGHPELEEAAIELMSRAVEEQPRFTVMKGDHIVEVHLGGMDKGKAITAFMTREPFLGRVPVYLGDDTTDEFGFHAVKKLDGIAIKVGEGPTKADYRLSCVDSVYRWLASPYANEVM